MRVISNVDLIENRLRWGRNLGLASLVVLLAGAFLTLIVGSPVLTLNLGGAPYEINTFIVSWTLLLIGFLLSQAALYLGNRYGVRYRPDRLIDNELRHFDDRWVALHHVSGLGHVLLSPLGAFAIDVMHQSGRIEYKDGHWKQHTPGRVLKVLFGGEGLGNPTRDAEVEAEHVAKIFERKGAGTDMPVRPMILFVNPETKVEAEDAPVPAVHVQKLKAWLRGAESSTTERVSKAAINHAAEALGGGIAEVVPARGPETEEETEPQAKRPVRRRRRSKSGKGKSA